MNRRLFAGSIWALLMAAVIGCGGKGDVAGTTETGNAGSRIAVSGTVTDSSGAALSGALVALLPADFNPLAPVTLSDPLTGVSASGGEFTISSAYSGEFALSAVHPPSGLRKILSGLSIDEDTDLGDIRLALPRTMVVKVHDDFFAGSSLYIPGTLHHAPLDSQGVAVFDSIAAERVDLVCYNPADDSLVAEYDCVRVRDTVDLTAGYSSNSGVFSAGF
jgi:hypothetical protein